MWSAASQLLFLHVLQSVLRGLTPWGWTTSSNSMNHLFSLSLYSLDIFFLLSQGISLILLHLSKIKAGGPARAAFSVHSDFYGSSDLNPSLPFLFGIYLTTCCSLFTAFLNPAFSPSLVRKSEAMQALRTSALAVAAIPIHKGTLFLFNLSVLQKLFLLPLKSLKSIHSDWIFLMLPIVARKCF